MKYTILNPDANTPARKHQSDAGLDLFAAENIIVDYHCHAIVRTGIAVKLPEGTMGLIKPKSRHTFLIGAGVIDQSYRGEIKIRIFNTHNGPLVIEAGQAIAQLIIVPVLTPELEYVPQYMFESAEYLTERGTSGGINEDQS